jgi:hypothetical protein
VAALTYRCVVSPEACPTSPTPGWCTNHPTNRLRPERQRFPSQPDLPAEDTGHDDVDQPGTGQAVAPPRGVGLLLLGEAIMVPPAGMVIGRDAPVFADIPGMSDLLQVSRRHARLYWRGDVLYVDDLDSVNGTYVDGVKLDSPRPVLPGQTLRLGLDVEITLVEPDLDEYGLPR